jgi:diacylglycerol O-acyltransferase
MEGRGESLDEVVISVPFSSRRATVGSELGNRSGVIPLKIPAGGDRTDRLAAVAAPTRAAKRAPRAASTAVLGPMFRGLARIGAYRLFINRQRMINTIVSSVHAPETAISMLGCTVTRIAPLGIPTGNLPVTFVALTYVGVLTITIVSDPDVCPDVRRLRAILIDELCAFASP